MKKLLKGNPCRDTYRKTKVLILLIITMLIFYWNMTKKFDLRKSVRSWKLLAFYEDYWFNHYMISIAEIFQAVMVYEFVSKIKVHTFSTSLKL